MSFNLPCLLSAGSVPGQAVALGSPRTVKWQAAAFDDAVLSTESDSPDDVEHTRRESVVGPLPTFDLRKVLSKLASPDDSEDEQSGVSSQCSTRPSTRASTRSDFVSPLRLDHEDESDTDSNHLEHESNEDSNTDDDAAVFLAPKSPDARVATFLGRRVAMTTGLDDSASSSDEHVCAAAARSFNNARLQRRAGRGVSEHSQRTSASAIALESESGSEPVLDVLPTLLGACRQDTSPEDKSASHVEQVTDALSAARSARDAVMGKLQRREGRATAKLDTSSHQAPLEAGKDNGSSTSLLVDSKTSADCASSTPSATRIGQERAHADLDQTRLQLFAGSSEQVADVRAGAVSARDAFLARKQRRAGRLLESQSSASTTAEACSNAGAFEGSCIAHCSKESWELVVEGANTESARAPTLLTTFATEDKVPTSPTSDNSDGPISEMRAAAMSARNAFLAKQKRRGTRFPEKLVDQKVLDDFGSAVKSSSACADAVAIATVAAAEDGKLDTAAASNGRTSELVDDSHQRPTLLMQTTPEKAEASSRSAQMSLQEEMTEAAEAARRAFLSRAMRRSGRVMTAPM